MGHFTNNMSESESVSGSSEEYSEEFEFEPVDPNEEGEGTRGLGDILAMVGIGGGDSGSPAAPLLDVNGNPIEAVYTDDGQVVAPRIVDEQGNVIHDGPEPKKEGMGTGTKLAIGGAVAGGVATGVGVHYYRKKQKEGGKGKKGKKGKKDKKDKDKKKDKKDKDGKKDKKDKDKKKDKKKK